MRVCQKMPKFAMTAAKEFPAAIEKMILPAPSPIIHDEQTTLWRSARERQSVKTDPIKERGGLLLR
jgi:hypothetical protein